MPIREIRGSISVFGLTIPFWAAMGGLMGRQVAYQSYKSGRNDIDGDAEVLAAGAEGYAAQGADI